MKKYEVKVVEKHVAYVWVKAESEEKAKQKAAEVADCNYDSLYDCEIIEEREVD